MTDDIQTAAATTTSAAPTSSSSSAPPAASGVLQGFLQGRTHRSSRSEGGASSTASRSGRKGDHHHKRQRAAGSSSSSSCGDEEDPPHPSTGTTAPSNTPPSSSVHPDDLLLGDGGGAPTDEVVLQLSFVVALRADLVQLTRCVEALRREADAFDLAFVTPVGSVVEYRKAQKKFADGRRQLEPLSTALAAVESRLIVAERWAQDEAAGSGRRTAAILALRKWLQGTSHRVVTTVVLEGGGPTTGGSRGNGLGGMAPGDRSAWQLIEEAGVLCRGMHGYLTELLRGAMAFRQAVACGAVVVA